MLVVGREGCEGVCFVLGVRWRRGEGSSRVRLLLR